MHRIGCRVFTTGHRLFVVAIALAAIGFWIADVGQSPRRTLAAAGCPPAGQAALEAIGRAYFDAFNTGDVAALDAMLAPDYRHHGAVVTEQDRAIHLERVTALRTAFPDGVYTIPWLIVDGDIVAVRNEFRGTHLGEYVGVPATGRRVAVGAFHVHRVVCRQIVETWNAGDGLGLFRQIGAIPGPATTPADDEARPAPTAQTPATCEPTTRGQNAAAARRWYDEVLNQGKFEVLDEILSPDVVHHAALFVDLMGREETGGSLRAIRAGFPNIYFTVDAVVATDDVVLIRWTGRGTQEAEFLGVPPSGNTVNWSGMNAFRFACGVIVEGWSEANGLEIFRQIGGLP